MKMHKVTLRINSSGSGEVLLDGQPLLVEAVTVTCEAQETPRVTFTLPADVDLEVETDSSSIDGLTCDKTTANCVSKFNNPLNYSGESAAPDKPDIMEIIRLSSRY